MINRQTVRDFQKDVLEALKDVETKYGVVIDLPNLQFSAEAIYAKLVAKEGEDKADVNQQEWNQYCKYFGLDKEDFDRMFTWKTRKYVIVGVRPSKRKYPIACRCVENGETYNFPISIIQQCLNK